MNFELLRNASVSVEAKGPTDKKHALITINGAHQHEFSADSRVSKSLALMSPEDLGERLTGGHYFVVDDQLVDFRDRSYNGFVHTDQSIEKLVEVVGIMRQDTPTNQMDRRQMTTFRSMKGNTVSKNIILGDVWSDHNIVVPGYAVGGDFNSQLVFTWNPFVKTVNSLFQLVRLICTNGMVGLTNFLNTRIPLINRWEEHLDIANHQIQNKMESIAQDRFSVMTRERASVAEINQVARHASDRMKHYTTGGLNHTADYTTARNIRNVVDPSVHLLDVYKEEVFGDKRLQAQLPSHLTTFDVYNLATELRSHTSEVPDSTNLALDRFANALLFNHENLIASAAGASVPRLSSFSDPDQAFFGVVH